MCLPYYMEPDIYNCMGNPVPRWLMPPVHKQKGAAISGHAFNTIQSAFIFKVIRMPGAFENSEHQSD